jgi:hypothetical protein
MRCSQPEKQCDYFVPLELLQLAVDKSDLRALFHTFNAPTHVRRPLFRAQHAIDHS